MLERLLKCRLCGGNVSSAASKCPHCGTSNFKPDSYIRELQLEAAARTKQILNQNAERKARLLAQQGYVADVDDNIYHSFFPHCARINLKIISSSNGHPEKTYGYRFSSRHELKLYFDGKVIGDEWNRVIDREYGNNDRGGNVVINPGTHQITVEYGKFKQAYTITLTRSSKYIVVNYCVHYNWLNHEYRELKHASVHVE